jgi:O-antigen ligase
MWHSGLFNQAAAYAAPRPFFVDHTAIGAALAFCIPVIIYYLLRKETSAVARRILGAVLILFTAAFILSYSRAAWLSMAVAAIVAVILLLKISWKIMVPLTVTAIIILTISWTDIIIRLNENRQESSADIARHLQSIANIRTDASNMERINRWKAAIRMSAERPFLGWGPGTYQFKYAPYQVSSDKTIISTNYGEGGNAHSEYLGALVDSGIPGLILYLVLICIFVSRGILIWKHHEQKSTRMLALALVAGLVTYIIHGGLNNFLDSDKISALFWGMIAAIVALDIAMRDKISSGSDSQVGSDN